MAVIVIIKPDENSNVSFQVENKRVKKDNAFRKTFQSKPVKFGLLGFIGLKRIFLIITFCMTYTVIGNCLIKQLTKCVIR